MSANKGRVSYIIFEIVYVRLYIEVISDAISGRNIEVAAVDEGREAQSSYKWQRLSLLQIQTTKQKRISYGRKVNTTHSILLTICFCLGITQLSNYWMRRHLR